MMVARYQRTGGHPPRNDELLEIQDDGTFTLRRVVGGTVIGEFAGTLEAKARTSLERRVGTAGLEPVNVATAGMPPVVREYITAGELAAEVSPEAKIPNKPLAALARLLRELTEELTEHPVAAVEARLSDDAKTLHLSVSGERPITIRGGKLTYDLFGEQEEFLSAGRIESPFSGADPINIDVGWSAEIALPEEVDFTPKKTLQVRLMLGMKYGDGTWRDAQMTIVAGKGWS